MIISPTLFCNEGIPLTCTIDKHLHVQVHYTVMYNSLICTVDKHLHVQVQNMYIYNPLTHTADKHLQVHVQNNIVYTVLHLHIYSLEFGTPAQLYKQVHHTL